MAGRAVSCDRRDTDHYGRLIGVCTAGGRDLNAAMVAAGLAWAYRRFSDDYAPEEDAARAAGRGVWRASTEPAWEYRKTRWSAAASTAPEGCPIKGNISRNGRIYHAPWSPWYSRTRINTEKGERWFCNEREALEAGWRAPNRDR